MEYNLTNDRIIALHRNRNNPPDYTKNSLLLSYEDWIYKNLERDIDNGHPDLQKKALIEIQNEFRQGHRIVLSALKSDIMKSLILYLKNSNEELRYLASLSLIQECKELKTRKIFIERLFIKKLIEMTNENSKRIKLNIFKCFEEISYGIDDINKWLNSNLPKILNDNLFEEKDLDIIETIMRIIKNILYSKEGTFKMLNYNIIENLQKYINKDFNKNIRILCLKNLSALSFNYIGKEKAIKLLNCEKISELYNDEDQNIRSLVYLNLTSLAQSIKGKQILINLDFVNKCYSELKNNKKLKLKLKLYIVQLISSLAEDQDCKIKAKILLPLLEKLKDEDELLKKFSNEAINIINWTP